MNNYLVIKKDTSQNNMLQSPYHSSLIHHFGLMGRVVEEKHDLFSDVMVMKQYTANTNDTYFIIISDLDEHLIIESLMWLFKIAFISMDYEEESNYSLHYILISNYERNDLAFRGLSMLVEKMNIGYSCAVNDLIKSHLSYLTKIRGVKNTITARSLRAIIEKHVFTGGQSELIEIIGRHYCNYHSLIDYLYKRIALRNTETDKVYSVENITPGIRILLGAYIVGDITKKTFELVLKSILSNDVDENALKELQKMLEYFDSINNIASAQSVEYKCRLANYISGKNILIIEDQLYGQLWWIILLGLFGAKIDDKCNIKNIENCENYYVEQDADYGYKGGFTLTHIKSCELAANKCVESLSNYDIILLDLYSSESKRKVINLHGGSTLYSLGSGITKLMARISNIYEGQKYRFNRRYEVPNSNTDVIPTALPQIVVFTGDYSPISIKTMMQQPYVADYFVKNASGDVFKSNYYSSFKSAIITALKDTVCHVLNLPYITGKEIFNEWLYQYLPAHRPIILSIMKHFRYYGAPSIIKSIDRYIHEGKYLSIERRSENDYDKLSLFKEAGKPATSYWISYLGRPNKSGPNTLSLMSKSWWIQEIRNNYKKGFNPELGKVVSAIKYRLPQFLTYDKLCEDIREYILSDSKKPITIIFVDDVIGSGGQVQKYLWKFINNKMHEVLYERDQWFKLIDYIRTGLISFHVIFAVGIKCRYFDNIEWQKKKYISPNGFSGELQINICHLQNHDETTKPDIPHDWFDEKEIEDQKKYGIITRQACNCPQNFSVVVHVADLNINLSDIVKGIKGLDIKSVLEVVGHKNYKKIVEPREREKSEDFEPLGWRECEGMIATYLNSPGNTIPLVWGDGMGPVKNGEEIYRHQGGWIPLFPRFFNMWDSG